MSVFVWHDGSGVWRGRLGRDGILGGSSLPEEHGGVLVCWRKDVSAGKGTMRLGGASRVLNDPAYARALRDDGLLRRKMALYGVRYEPAGPKAVRAGGENRPWIAAPGRERWTVGVFDLQAVDIRCRTAGDGGGDFAANQSGKEAPPGRLARIARFAVRAVYAAGLDFAVASIRLEGEHRAVLEGLDPAPELSGGEWEPWRNALAELAGEAGRPESDGRGVTLGMDPEFVLLNERGKVVPASRFFAKDGMVGCDNVTVPGRAGTRPLAELRPAPSRQPEELVRHLRRAMWAAALRIGDPGLKWVAGGMPVKGLPLGGHIHFSGVPLNGALVRALDNYLALPLVLFEDETAAARRKKYGKPGDIRRKSHGGFEYRTLPSLIVSPRMTKGALALAKLVAEHCGQLTERPLDDPDLLEAFAAGDKERLAPVARRLWKQVESLDGYAAYAHFLDPLAEWMEAGKTWRSDGDIRRAWRIPPF